MDQVLKLRNAFLGSVSLLCMFGCCACPAGEEFGNGGEPVLYGIRIKVGSNIDPKSLQVNADKNGETGFATRDGRLKNWIGFRTPDDSGRVYVVVYGDFSDACESAPPPYSVAPLKIAISRDFAIDTIFTFDTEQLKNAVMDSTGYFLGDVNLSL